MACILRENVFREFMCWFRVNAVNVIEHELSPCVVVKLSTFFDQPAEYQAVLRTCARNVEQSGLFFCFALF